MKRNSFLNKFNEGIHKDMLSSRLSDYICKEPFVYDMMLFYLFYIWESAGRKFQLISKRFLS